MTSARPSLSSALHAHKLSARGRNTHGERGSSSIDYNRLYKQPKNASVSGERASALGRPCVTAQASGRQGWLAPACQLGNRSLFWATNRLTHGFLQRYQIFPQPFSIPSSGSALGRYCKRLRVYPVSPWVNLYVSKAKRNNQ